MKDPYIVLGIGELVSDEAVQEAYHRCLRQFPPEHFPERFAEISNAYEAIRTKRQRTRLALFGPYPTVDELGDYVGDLRAVVPRVEKQYWLNSALRLWVTRESGEL